MTDPFGPDWMTARLPDDGGQPLAESVLEPEPLPSGAAFALTERELQRALGTGHMLQNIFGGPGHRDGPPYIHTLKLPATEEEMAAEPPPPFTLEDGG